MTESAAVIDFGLARLVQIEQRVTESEHGGLRALGNDPKNWQHVAFTIYTDLCEVDSWAQAALDDDE